MRTSLLVLVAAVLAGTIHLLYYLPRLPERVATHFGLAGRADGWSDVATFATFATILLLAFALFAPLINALISRLPPSLINIPHREFWLAEERREATLDRLRGAMEWFGVASVLFAIAINHFTVTANLEAATSGEEARLSSGFLWALGIYMAWTLAWVGRLLWSFRQPPDENAAIGPA
ncbi:MAG: DUF1648 domain-containing protein [Acidobacteria bacterium]|nr:MAG: DUF1648 domain-containing protein [Acidobacteriota bacterium]REK07744.1 MAG: DUF1648 domain-containing protein [Acidobacteriota bacterium]